MGLLRVAILDCDTPVPSIVSSQGLYSNIFSNLFQDTVKALPGLGDLEFKFTTYDAVKGGLPSEKELLELDGIVITGSCKLLLLYCCRCEKGEKRETK